jgi:hypothetical protein
VQGCAWEKCWHRMSTDLLSAKFPLDSLFSLWLSQRLHVSAPTLLREESLENTIMAPSGLESPVKVIRCYGSSNHFLQQHVLSRGLILGGLSFLERIY